MDLEPQREGELETPLLSAESPMETMDVPGENDNGVAVDGVIEAEDSDVWYRNPQQVTAMISNFSTSYNVVNISLVLPILQQLQEASSEDKAACASSLLAGMIVGQLVGGALGDTFIGRMGALKIVMGLQVMASIASSCLSVTRGNIYVKLALWRFVLGVGAGGVYPLAAILSAEQGKGNTSEENLRNDQEKKDRLHRVVLTFSMQGLGFVAVPLLAVPLLHITPNFNIAWRILLAAGCIPGLFLLLLQMSLFAPSHRAQPLPSEEPNDEVPMPCTENGESEAIVNLDGMDTSGVTRHYGWWDAIRREPGIGYKLIGTAGTWFLFDVLFYGNTLFQPIVVEAAFGAAKSESPIHLLQKTAIDSLLLTSIALPGYAMIGLLIGKRTFCITQTPRYVMMQGFAIMAILYFTIGSNWTVLRHHPTVLVLLYGLTFFFANYGPNTTTFILPSLVYSPECRSTWNGISAASGKLGALFGATLFAPAADRLGDDNVMVICSVIAVVALAITWCFVPKANDDQREAIPQQQNDAEGTTETFEAA